MATSQLYKSASSTSVILNPSTGSSWRLFSSSMSAFCELATWGASGCAIMLLLLVVVWVAVGIFWSEQRTVSFCSREHGKVSLISQAAYPENNNNSTETIKQAKRVRLCSSQTKVALICPRNRRIIYQCQHLEKSATDQPLCQTRASSFSWSTWQNSRGYKP